MTVLDAGVALGRRVLRAKPEPATAPTTDHLLRPRLLPDVAVHAPLAAGGPWTAQRGENHYVRLGTDLARLASALDGVRDHAALARVLGPPWTEAAVHVGVVALDRASLLQREQRSATRGAHRRHGRHRTYRPPRLRVVPPFTLQLAIHRSGDRVAGALDRLFGWAFPGIAAALVVLGIVGTAATVWHWDDVYAVLGSARGPAGPRAGRRLAEPHHRHARAGPRLDPQALRRPARPDGRHAVLPGARVLLRRLRCLAAAPPQPAGQGGPRRHPRAAGARRTGRPGRVGGTPSPIGKRSSSCMPSATSPPAC